MLFWSFTVFFHAYTRLDILKEAGTVQFLLEVVVRNLLLAAVIYFAVMVVMPGIENGRKTVSYLFMLLISVLMYVLLKNAHDYYLYNDVIQRQPPLSFFSRSFYNFSIVIFYLAFATAIHFTKQWWQQREHIRQIEMEKLNTELEYLKAQMNPHFLFNSLNTVFFQIDKQNVQARDTLSRFSDMLRYQLYECNGKEIAVDREIKYLRNYVELQRLRTDENYSIRFSCSEDLNGFKLPPLLLLPFVENAFKHVSHFNDKKNEINIDVRKNGNLFQLKVLNTRDPAQQLANGGIGLKNVKRRLELLYKDRFLLDIIDKEEMFEVNLDLKMV